MRLRTIKDRVFLEVVIIWALALLCSTILYGETGGFLTNVVGIILMGIITLVKVRNDRFAQWLETDLD